MNTIILISVVLVAIATLAYKRASLGVFTFTLAAIFMVSSIMNITGGLTWAIFLAIFLPLNITSVRRSLISAPLLTLFQKIMPEMSQTEKEALDAGTTWWDSDLFRGRPDWEKMHNFPRPRLTKEEQAFLDGPCEEVCRMSNDWEITHERADLSPEIWQYLKDNKFFAMIIKKEYGGLEFSAYAQSRVLQKLTSVSAVLSSTVGVPNSLGPGELLQHYGTDDQKNHYLPRLAEGLEVPCFALTSPEAGSDAGAIPDFGIVCKGQWKGEEVLGMRLTWNKRYITLAPVATVLGLAFKLRDPDNLLGDKEDIGITCALIPTDIDGVEIGRRHFPLNLPFQNGPTRGNDVFVPLDFIIGGPDMAGQGWRMLVECLSVGRCITLPSNSTGGAKSLALATGAYSRIRRQFKLPIGKLEGIEEPLARIGGNAYMMDAATSLASTGVDLGEKPSVISAIVKCHMTEKMRSVLTDAIDIHGGKGVMLGPNNYLGRGYQAAPISITVEGANILTRNMIIYGQGAIRCHPYVLAELEAAGMDDKQQALHKFDKALFGHIGYAISNAFSSLILSWTGAHFASAPYKDGTAIYYKKLERFSAHLALLSDVAMGTLGGDLKRRERVSARMGDMLSYLYIGSATLKRYNDEGRNIEDLPFVHWSLQDCLNKLEIALDELLANFPAKWVGRFMRFMVMPFGKTCRKPSDKLDHVIARVLQTPSETRSRLAVGQYLTRDKENLIGRMEQTLDDILAAEPLFDRVVKASGEKLPFFKLDLVAQKGFDLGVLTEQEVELLQRAEKGRLEAINVDDFDPLELMVKKELYNSEQQGKAA